MFLLVWLITTKFLEKLRHISFVFKSGAMTSGNTAFLKTEHSVRAVCKRRHYRVNHITSLSGNIGHLFHLLLFKSVQSHVYLVQNCIENLAYVYTAISTARYVVKIRSGNVQCG